MHARYKKKMKEVQDNSYRLISDLLEYNTPIIFEKKDVSTIPM